MPPIVFDLALARRRNFQPRGVGPTWQCLPLPATCLRIFGTTKDSTGVALPSCSVYLFRTADNLLMDFTVSGADGSYEFRSAGLAETYYVVAYKTGSPDVAGTTVNTLTGTG